MNLEKDFTGVSKAFLVKDGGRGWEVGGGGGGVVGPSWFVDEEKMVKSQPKNFPIVKIH